MRTRGRILGGASALAMLSFGVAPAMAQEGPAASAAPVQSSGADQAGGVVEDDAIIVTAQRRQQSLMDVPQAVQALTGDDLQSTGISDIASTIQLIPGASIVGRFGPGNQVFQIRSVATGEGLGDPSVGYYLDSFAFHLPGLPFAPVADLYDLQRVEVIRGPSGTLFGLGSIGGTIRVLTNDADPSGFAGSAHATGALTDGGGPSWSGDLMLNVPVVEGRFALRGVLSYERVGGYVPIFATGEENANFRHGYTARIRALARPTDDLTLRLDYWRSHQFQKYCDRITYLNPLAIDQTNGRCTSNYDLISGDISYDAGFATIQSSTGYLKADILADVAGFVPFPVGPYHSRTPWDSESFIEDLRLVSNGSGPLTYILGVFYQKAHTFGGQDTELPETLLIPGNVGQRQTSSGDKLFMEAYSIYGEATYSLLNGLVSVTAGGRYYSEQRTLNQNNSVTLISLGTTRTTVETIESNNHSFSPRFNIALHPNEDGMIYAEIAKGFRSGSIVPTSILVAANVALGTNYENAQPPDSLWNYEAGVKWTFARRLRVELSGYHFNWKGAQVGNNPAGTQFVAPIGDVRSYGVDLSLAWRTPLDGLDLQLTGNLNRTRLYNVVPGLTARRPYLANGASLTGTARRTYAFVANYDAPLGGTGLNLRMNARYSYRSPQRSIYDGKLSPSIHLAAARIGVGNDSFDVALFSENLFNERGPLTANGGQYLIPYPRQIGVSAEFRF